MLPSLAWMTRKSISHCNQFRVLASCQCPLSLGVKKVDKKVLNWVKAAGVRAVKTVAQTAVATIGTAAVMDEVNWMMVGSAALLAGVLSLLTSVAGLPELSDE